MATDAPTASLELQLKRVLRFMPAPVGIVTTVEPETGAPVGLAISALMPVSLEPCAMAICVNRGGSSYAALVASGQFCINLLGSDQSGHLARFSDPAARSTRFAQQDWRRRAIDGMWYIDDAPANIFCTMRARVDYGTHDLIIGEVSDLFASDSDDILGWANGAAGRMQALASGEMRR